jgi:hypothetical protein
MEKNEKGRNEAMEEKPQVYKWVKMSQKWGGKLVAGQKMIIIVLIKIEIGGKVFRYEVQSEL